MKLRYSPGGEGEWLLVAARATAVLFRAVTAELAEPLLAALEGEQPVQAVLDLFTSRGLASAPAFALVSWSDATGAVLLARGDIVLGAETSAGPVRLDGRTVTSWHEKRVEDAAAVGLGELGAAASTLGLEAGAVWASAASVAEPVPDAGPASAGSPADVPENTIAELTESVSPTLAELFEAHPDLDDSEGYGRLFEETVVRSIEDAAVRPVEPPDAEPSDAERDAGAVTDPEGDHDGMTVMSGDLAALRASRPASDPDSAPRVPAGRALYLELSTGGREPIGVEPVLVGRSPSVRKVSSGAVPRLVTIPGDQDISRNHARFELEGDTVVVTDLHSRNGTSIVLPGKPPQVLRQGEPTAVIVGTVVDLGGGVTLTVREGE